jgi:hypothetical protein
MSVQDDLDTIENEEVIKVIDASNHVTNPTMEDVKSILTDGFKVFQWGDNKKDQKKSRVVVDAFTANGLITVYNAMNPDMRAKMNRMINGGPNQFSRVVDFMWGCVK